MYKVGGRFFMQPLFFITYGIWPVAKVVCPVDMKNHTPSPLWQQPTFANKADSTPLSYEERGRG